MATNKPLTPEEAVDMGRRAVGRRALMRTLRDIFSYRNPLRQFMDAYRFNVIRWSASNLREPTPGKRVRLFLGISGNTYSSETGSCWRSADCVYSYRTFRT